MWLRAFFPDERLKPTPNEEVVSPNVGESSMVLKEYPTLALRKQSDGLLVNEVCTQAYIGMKLSPR